MVSIAALNSATSDQLVQGLSAEDGARVLAALDLASAAYGDKTCSSGQSAFEFAVGVASTLAFLRIDAETRIAGLMFEATLLDPSQAPDIEPRFGPAVAELVSGVRQLIRLRELTQTHPASTPGRGRNAAQQAVAQVETLRKMLLAMASDMRVVLVRLASCVTTLRYFADIKRFDEVTHAYGRETLDLYAPLANRLGIWQLKWELEDLSFRFIEPETYKRIAKMLEEKRMMREGFVSSSITRLQNELNSAGIKAEVFGRPKHIYSIWSKMRGKELDFTELYDVRAFRVIVDDVKTCYTVLGVVHNIWTPIPKEFDDYISRPKPNGYRSLHTVVTADDGRPLEVQIRTQEMHNFAEYGVAAHWRYKEEGGSNFQGQKYDEKIAWLRQLLAWKSDVADTVVAAHTKGETVASRKASQIALEAFTAALPELLGGSADLTGSNLTNTKSTPNLRFDQQGAVVQTEVEGGKKIGGRHINYGVREFGMAAIMNGVALHGGFIPYGAIALFIMGPIHIAIPVLASSTPQLGAAAFGAMLGAHGAGTLLGKVVSGMVPRLRV
eukprot:gene31838-39328_t